MNDPRKAFQKILRDNPYDQTTRLVYADWLEEHGDDKDYDEAVRQREWTPEWQKAKEYLTNYAKRLNESDYGRYRDEDDPYSYPERKLSDYYGEDEVITLEKLIAAVDGEGIFLPYDTPDFVYYEREEFECQFRIYTRRGPDDNVELSVYCSC